MNRNHLTPAVFVLVLLTAALCQPARGTPITLTSADAGGGYAPGKLLYAYHFYGHNLSLFDPTHAPNGPLTYVIQGVTFLPFDVEPPSDNGPSTFGSLTFMSFSAPGSYEGTATANLGAGANNDNLETMLTNQAWYSSFTFAGQHTPIQLIAADLVPGTKYQVDVLAYGDTSHTAEFTFIGAGSPGTDLLDAFTEVGGSYYDVHEVVVADALGQINVHLISPDADIGSQFRVGAISITVAPEPASVGLLALGGLTLLRRKR